MKINLITKLASVMLFLFSSATIAGTSSADLIIHGDYVVTMNEDNQIIENGAVAVQAGKILAVGESNTISKSYSAKREIKGENRVIMPGLINGHTHSAMTLFRGIADDLPLMVWLTQYIFPAEIRFVDEEFVRVGTSLACLEMIKGGTTAFVDMYFHPKVIASVVEQCGVRAVIGAAVIEQESGYTKNFSDAMQKAEDFIAAWNSKSARIQPAIAAHAAYTITPENLKYITARAKKWNVPIAIHISEDRAELKMVTENYGTTPIHHLHNIGLFEVPTIGAHVVHPTKEEIPLLAKYKVAAVHCPTSNLKVAAGISPVPEMIEAGVPLALGTDGAASNNDLDMWDEIKLAALLHKERLANPQVMPAQTVLRAATINGATAVGFGNITGSLEPGKQADLIQISLQDVHLIPLYDVISHLTYAVDSQDVQTVIVDGKVLMQDRQVLTLDEKAITREAAKIAAQINAEIRTAK